LSAQQISSLHSGGYDRIVSQETSVGDVWQACVTPNDGTEDGNQSCSNNLTVLSPVPNTPPIAENITLNSTLGTNYTEENLTVHYDLHDDDSDPLTGIVDWRVDGASAAILNFAFDTEVTGASSTVRDYSSRERNATLGASAYPVWQNSSACLSGGCYLFDGEGDTIDVASADHGIGTGDLTIEAWVYPLSTANWKSIGVFGDWTFGLYIADGYLVLHPDTNTSDTLITTDNWHHVAATRSGGNITYYLDGSPDGTGNTSAAPPALFRIGADGWGPDSFNGSIDSLRLYNHSLSAQQIAAIHNSGTPAYNSTVSQETSPGEVWQACVTPNDGTEDGNTSCSNTLTVLSSEPPNTPPVAENVTLSSTFGTNLTDENLTVSWDSYDADDSVYNVTNWLLNSTPITLLNMPFEATGGNESSWTKDYSGLGNDATVGGASWIASGGRDGWGAYDFGGSSYIELEESTAFDSLMDSDAVTVSLWVNPDTISSSSTDEDTIMFSDQFIIRMESSDELETYIADDSNNWCRLGTTTSPMATGQWQHIVFRQNGTHLELFRNGLSLGTPANCVGIDDQLSYGHAITLGCREQSGYNECMDGKIDDVMVFDRSLSDAQIALLSQNRTDVIHSDETSLADVWQACITPNDGTEDGAQNCSDTLTVVEAAEPPSYDIDSCAEISANGTYTLTANLTSGSGACLNITGDDITILCDGHMISDDGEGLGILLQDVDNVTLEDCIVRNFSIGISLDNATNVSINNVSSTDNTDYNYLIDESGDVKMTDSDAMRGNKGGARIIRSQRVHIDPSWFCDNSIGILVNQSNDTLIEDSIACNNTQYGMHVIDSDNTTILNSRTFNNARDLMVENSLSSSVAFNATHLVFDRPAGDMQAHTTVNIVDSFSSGGNLSLNWSVNDTSLPAGVDSFEGMYVNLSGSEQIGSLAITWTGSQSAGYNESRLSLYRSNGTVFSDTGATLDVDANSLTLSSHTPGSVYGVLYNGTIGYRARLYGANVSNVTHHARYNSTAAGNRSTEGGNITELNVNSTQLTER
jgi:parallel beta-helix repeat protein